MNVGGLSSMWLVVIGAALTFAILLFLIVRELLGKPAPTAAPSAAKSPPPNVSLESEVDVTKVGRGPKPALPRPEQIPQIPITEEDAEYSPPTQSALTLYEDESGLDEPTGPHELILVHSVGQTDQGKRRRRNEDSYLVLPRQGIFAVADGMGGYAGGDVASNLAVDTIRRAFEANDLRGNPDPRRPLRGNELVWSVEAANRAIFECAKQHDEYQGMGTTLVAARFSPKKQRVYVAHVGDSRCYRMRGGSLTQLTTDHTLAAVGVTGPYASHLRRAVGIRDQVKVDLVVDTPRPGDLYLLCSDGLSKMVSDDVIRDVVRKSGDLDAAVADLVARANDSGGKDNVTVILLSVVPPSRLLMRS